MVTLPTKRYKWQAFVTLVSAHGHASFVSFRLADHAQANSISCIVMGLPMFKTCLALSLSLGGIKGIMGWLWDWYIKNNIGFNYIY